MDDETDPGASGGGGREGGGRGDDAPNTHTNHPSHNHTQAAAGDAALPPLVLRRLLTADAGALDDLLCHTSAAAAAVAALTAAWEAGGVEAVEGAPLPRLTWTEMRQLTAAREKGEKGVVITAAAVDEQKALPAGAAALPCLPPPSEDAAWDALEEWVDG